MMHYVGIDVSKETFHVCMNENAGIIKFNNDKSGRALFVDHLKLKGYLPGNSTIGLESTGSYHIAISFCCTKAGYRIHVINPLIVSKQNQTTLRRVKTDPADARLIRFCLLNGAGYPFQETTESFILKTLVRQRSSLSLLRQRFRLKQAEIQTRETYLNSPITEINKELLTFLKQKIHELDQILSRYQPTTQKLLRSIPGVGLQTAVTLLSEIGDIHRFPDAQKLTAYIGLDPRVRLSGTSIHGKGYITKRGNKLLRTRLYNAASSAVLHQNLFRVFFEKKRSEGKPYRVALCAVMRKMVHVIHAVWLRGTPFLEDNSSLHA